MSGFGYTVLGFGAHPNRTAPSPYVSFSDISTLSLDSDFATLQIDGSNFSFPTAIAVGGTTLVVGLAAVFHFNNSSKFWEKDINIFSFSVISTH